MPFRDSQSPKVVYTAEKPITLKTLDMAVIIRSQATAGSPGHASRSMWNLAQREIMFFIITIPHSPFLLPRTSGATLQ